MRRVFESGAYADRALRSEARDLNARDHALAQRLAYGAIQRRDTLDHLIERLSARPLGRLDQPVLAALRLGLYELLYMRSPDHAVLADTVELAKTHARAGHGLVNAVLRRATREGAALLGELSDDTPEKAAVKHSHPEWIAQMWWRELGPDRARALMAYDNEPGEVALRVNTLLTDPTTLADELPVPTRADPDMPEALVLIDRAFRGSPGGLDDGPNGGGSGGPHRGSAGGSGGSFDLYASPAWRRGAFVAQSRAAMLVSRTLAPEPGETILDLCAAPGGKTTHISALMNATGQVVAVERNRRRAAELVRTVQRLHAANVRVELADASRPRPEGAVFDRVLVDPPCSGLGTLQARPDLRWRTSPSRLSELKRIQAGILAAGAESLRPGGVLVYSTCTISPTENELQIAAFLDSHDDFVLDDLSSDLSSIGQPDLRHPSPDVPREVALTLPHRDRTAGFFIARLRRTS